MKTHVRRMTFPLHLRVQLCETVKLHFVEFYTLAS
uniref:Uncharacterized protein n=1 Tax=Anguilla anguilla TaxID=7936 RepID=A0A0E9VFM7_ANGAN